jgi:hypothetical protein
MRNIIMYEYGIGDVLRVKQFEDMDRPRFGFSYNMRHMCGKRFTVKSVLDGEAYTSEEGIEDRGDGSSWAISADMLEFDNTAPENAPLFYIDTDAFFITINNQHNR